MWEFLVTIWILGGTVSGIEVLGTFRHEGTVPTAHDLKSGPIELLDTKTIKIPNLFYSDSNPDEPFWIVGNGKPPRFGHLPMPGFVIPNDKQNCDVLAPYQDETIQLVLPGSFTVNNVDWLAMHDIKQQVTFGWIDFAEKRNGPRFQNVMEAPAGTVLPDLCPQSNRSLKYFILPKEGGTDHGHKVDSIELTSVQTIRIRNLYYDGTCPEAYWMVGNGTPPVARTEKTPGNQIPNEAGSCDALKKYSRNTVQLVLPDTFTVNNIDWLAMYCITEKQVLGWVNLIGPRSALPFTDLTPLPPYIVPPKPCGESMEKETSTESKQVDGSGQSKLSGSGLILLGILVPVYQNWALHF